MKNSLDAPHCTLLRLPGAIWVATLRWPAGSTTRIVSPQLKTVLSRLLPFFSARRNRAHRRRT